MEFLTLLPIGSLANALAIILGSAIGIIFKSKISSNLQGTLLKTLGLSVAVLGIKMSIPVEHLLEMVFSIGLGTVIGEYIDIENLLEKVSMKLKKDNESFSGGFVTSTLLYCVGSLAILGAVQEGTNGDPSLLYTKAFLDGMVSIALASALGIGVLFSAIPVLLYQGTVTVISAFLATQYPEGMINQLSATGGIMIMAFGLNMAGAIKVKVGNILPALFISIILSLLFKH